MTSAVSCHITVFTRYVTDNRRVNDSYITVI